MNVYVCVLWVTCGTVCVSRVRVWVSVWVIECGECSNQTVDSRPRGQQKKKKKNNNNKSGIRFRCSFQCPHFRPLPPRFSHPFSHIFHLPQCHCPKAALPGWQQQENSEIDGQMEWIYAKFLCTDARQPTIRNRYGLSKVTQYIAQLFIIISNAFETILSCSSDKSSTRQFQVKNNFERFSFQL